MKPTNILQLIRIFVLVGWVFGVIAYALRIQIQFYLQVPLNLFVATLSMTVAIGSWTLLARKRIAGPERTFTAIQSARTAALALAGSRTGTIISGGAFGLTLSYALAPATQANTERIQILSLTLISALLLVMVSLWLERICRIPDSQDDK